MLQPVPKPKREPRPNTWIGRYHPAMEWIERNVTGRRSRPLQVLVAGIGGGGHPQEGSFEPAEPIEVALALHRAKVRFSMTAMDVNPESIRRLQRQLENGQLEFAEEKPPTILVLGAHLNPAIARWTYLGTLLGAPFEGGRKHIHLPEEIRNAIRLQGPQRRGNVFGANLPKKNDLVTTFNVSMYYDKFHQAKLAERLYDSLRTGGIIITHSLSRQDPFIQRLNALFGPNGRIQQMPSMEQGTIHVFKKTPPKR